MLEKIWFGIAYAMQKKQKIAALANIGKNCYCRCEGNLQEALMAVLPPAYIQNVMFS